jgi:hypothetical protein
MPDFYYQTSIKVTGPWLVDINQLLALDAIVADQWQRLGAYREKRINQKVEQLLADEIEDARPNLEKKGERDELRDSLRSRVENDLYNVNYELDVTLLLTGGKKLIAKSFKEASSHVGASDAEVAAFLVNMSVAEVRAYLEFDGRYDQVSLHISPENLPESREAFSAMREWVTQHRPKRWQQLWGNLIFFLWVFWLFGVAFLGSSWFSIFAKPPSDYQKQAVELLKQGITVTNQTKAIEALLGLQTGYNPGPRASEYPRWWWPSIALGLLACAAFSIKPGSHIGIGRGERTVKLWRGWIRILTVVGPGLMFSSFVWPAIGDFIKSLFK